ncbi:Rhodanese-related sulfurtransferase [Marininema mesophilum]|uniref:Rhodanese-related sulfurtransferase n=1 Tax=Marininema mesophilum TaxID=1048340 RepID=A0A1H2UP39_9BACL|nr:rhodanese-like domain-containing protein [Marininema mesophilum]SDW57871.1 Rhodanese-related sulfurtransferase [Marininema mesophilum]
MGKEEHFIEAKRFAKKYQLRELEQALLLDVREEREWEIYRLEEALLIPLHTLPYNLDRLDQKKEIYVLCAHGVRSAHAAHFLHQQGYPQVINVEGGMAEVSLHLDEEDVRPK